MSGALGKALRSIGDMSIQRFSGPAVRLGERKGFLKDRIREALAPSQARTMKTR